MAPKRSRQEKKAPQADPQGIFHGMVVFLVQKGVQPRRLQIWKQKLMQMGAVVEDRLKKTVTHIFAMSLETILQELGLVKLKDFKGNILLYEWLENSLKSGERLTEDSYALKMAFESGHESDKPAVSAHFEMLGGTHLCSDSPENRGTRISPEGSKLRHKEIPKDGEKTGDQGRSIAELEHGHNVLHSGDEVWTCKEDTIDQTVNRCSTSPENPSADGADTSKELSLLYNPPDFNRNITDIFGKLVNIYRALGDDRRSFSYYKAIPVIEKLPFKIESVEQVKHLPAIGKSMQDHVDS